MFGIRGSLEKTSYVKIGQPTRQGDVKVGKVCMGVTDGTSQLTEALALTVIHFLARNHADRHLCFKKAEPKW